MAVLNPLIQMLAYWFVFGMGIRGGQPIVIGGVEIPFIIWMLAGLIPWFSLVRPFLMDQTVCLNALIWYRK